MIDPEYMGFGTWYSPEHGTGPLSIMQPKEDDDIAYEALNYEPTNARPLPKRINFRGPSPEETAKHLYNLTGLTIRPEDALHVVKQRAIVSKWEKDPTLPTAVAAREVSGGTGLPFYDLPRILKRNGFNEETAEEFLLSLADAKRFALQNGASMRMAGERLPAIMALHQAVDRDSAALMQATAPAEMYNGEFLRSINAGHVLEAAAVTPLEYHNLVSKGSLQPYEVSEIERVYEPAVSKANVDIRDFIKLNKAYRAAESEYGNNNSLVAHYRHGAASPQSLTANGLLVFVNPTETRNPFMAVNLSEDREAYANGWQGRERHMIEHWDQDQLRSEIASRGKHGWYTNYLHPEAEQSGLAQRLSYQGPQRVVGWRTVTSH